MKLMATRCHFAALDFLLAAFFVLLPSCSKVAGQTSTINEEHQVEIRLKPDKETIMLNEPTFLSFEIKNYLSQDLCLGIGGDYRNSLGRPDSFKVTVSRDSRCDQFYMGALRSFVG